MPLPSLGESLLCVALTFGFFYQVGTVQAAMGYGSSHPLLWAL